MNTLEQCTRPSFQLSSREHVKRSHGAVQGHRVLIKMPEQAGQVGFRELLAVCCCVIKIYTPSTTTTRTRKQVKPNTRAQTILIDHDTRISNYFVKPCHWFVSVGHGKFQMNLNSIMISGTHFKTKATIPMGQLCPIRRLQQLCGENNKSCSPSSSFLKEASLWPDKIQINCNVHPRFYNRTVDMHCVFRIQTSNLDSGHNQIGEVLFR